ncbi:MAG: Hsp20/alpha crystallin family protein [Saprospiraceae bacterium]
MSLIKWNQPKTLATRRNWIENFLAETDSFFKNMDWNVENDVPAINVKEEENNFLFEVAAPGMKKEDFKVDLDNGVLMISAKSEDTKEEKENDYVRQEFSYRNFQRSFWLPESVDADKINAQYEQGVLKLSIPKLPLPAASTSKSISIS